MRAVALILSIAVAGCFPHNQKARTISKYAEGGLIVAGIGLEFIASTKTGADCDAMGMAGMSSSSCHASGTALGGVGLAMILAGVTGFIATISTAEETEKKTAPPRIDIKAQPTAKPEVKLPPGTQPAPGSPAPDPNAPPAATPTGSAGPSQPAP
jgi:hypothetical protein